MKLVDVHIHLDFPEYENDLDDVVKKAKEESVSKIIANGVNKVSNRKVLEISKKYDIVEPALGFYPADVYPFSEEELDGEIDFIKKNKECVGYGEVGLDNKFGNEKKVEDKKKKQRGVFEKFVELSEKTRKPLIIHSRKAELEVLEMLESSSLKNPVLHCFMGKKKLVHRAADNGFNLSVLPMVTKLQQIQELVEYTDLNQLLTETDGPYMHPDNVRNTPESVLLGVKKIAEIKKVSEEEVADNIFSNYKKLFKTQK